MILKELLRPFPFVLVKGITDHTITSVTSDSRKVIPGSLFIALKGHNIDGHNFIPQAIDKGAVAVAVERGFQVGHSEVTVIEVEDTRRLLAILADRYYGQPSHKLKVIGVTGTNGKTTVTHLIHKILTDYGVKVGLIGTIHMLIGERSVPVDNTTPESIDLQSSMAEMVDEGCTYAVMEVSSHALEQGRVRGISFQTGIFTNLSQDHLDYHGTMEEYKQIKSRFFAQLGNDYGETLRPAILNVDDPASAFYRKVTAAPVITYGIDQPADVRATHIHVTAEGLQFQLETWQEKREVNLKLIGKFNVYNALAAIVATLIEGVPLDHILTSLQNISGVDGRFEKVDEGQNFTVIVDYAHTPDSLENVLTTIKQFGEGKVICVVGCGGDRDRTKRPLMAKIAAKYSDYAILTSDNPRTENPQQIIDDMIAGLKEDRVSENTYAVIVDRRDGIRKAIEIAGDKDVILIAGKGHETYQIIGKEVIHFDDREVAKEAIHDYHRK